jgi:DMSO/TMAO reductase YedYZ molybdopterin-dependent catalytic subunit
MTAIDPTGELEGENGQITTEELALAARNHGMPLEGLRYDITPIGMHYLLIHFDIPVGDAETWALEVGGSVARPLTLSTSAPARRSRCRSPWSAPATAALAWSRDR